MGDVVALGASEIPASGQRSRILRQSQAPAGYGKADPAVPATGLEPCFIPLAEPWRNGVVEKFNHHWREKFLGRVVMTCEEDLRRESLAFEQRHNIRYRYSKLHGKTPMEALAASKKPLRFPNTEEPPKLPLPKPETGCYCLIAEVPAGSGKDEG